MQNQSIGKFMRLFTLILISHDNSIPEYTQNQYPSQLKSAIAYPQQQIIFAN